MAARRVSISVVSVKRPFKAELKQILCQGTLHKVPRSGKRNSAAVRFFRLTDDELVYIRKEPKLSPVSEIVVASPDCSCRFDPEADMDGRSVFSIMTNHLGVPSSPVKREEWFLSPADEDERDVWLAGLARFLDWGVDAQKPNHPQIEGWVNVRAPGEKDWRRRFAVLNLIGNKKGQLVLRLLKSNPFEKPDGTIPLNMGASLVYGARLGEQVPPEDRRVMLHLQIGFGDRPQMILLAPTDRMRDTWALELNRVLKKHQPPGTAPVPPMAPPAAAPLASMARISAPTAATPAAAPLAAAAAIPASASNPFDDGGDDAGDSASSGNNPFGDDDGDLAAASSRGGPFAGQVDQEMDEKTSQSALSAVVLPAAASADSNPFGDDDDDEVLPRPSSPAVSATPVPVPVEDGELRRLRAELADCQNFAQQQQADAQRLRGETAQLQSRLQELQAHKGDLEARCGELQAVNSQLQAEAGHLEIQNKELQTQSTDLQNDNHQLRSQADELKAAHDQLQTKSGELKALNDQLQNKNGELQTKNNELKASAALAVQQLADALARRGQHQSDEESAAARQEDASQLRVELQEQRQQLVELRAEKDDRIGELQAQLAEVMAVNATMKTETQSEKERMQASFDQEKESMQSASGKATAQLKADAAGLQQELARLQLESADLRGDLSKLQEETSELREESTALRGEVSQLKDASSSKNARIADLEAELAEVNTKGQEYVDYLNTTHAQELQKLRTSHRQELGKREESRAAQAASAEAEQKRLRAELAVAAAGLAESKARCKKLEGQLESQRHQEQLLRQQLEQQTQLLDERSSSADADIQRSEQAFRVQLGALGERNKALEARIEALEQDIETLEQEKRSLETSRTEQVEALEAKVTQLTEDGASYVDYLTETHAAEIARLTTEFAEKSAQPVAEAPAVEDWEQPLLEVLGRAEEKCRTVLAELRSSSNHRRADKGHRAKQPSSAVGAGGVPEPKRRVELRLGCRNLFTNKMLNGSLAALVGVYVQEGQHDWSLIAKTEVSKAAKNPDFPGFAVDGSVVGRRIRLAVFDTKNPAQGTTSPAELLGQVVLEPDWAAREAREYSLEHPDGADSKLGKQLRKHKPTVRLEFRQVEAAPAASAAPLDAGEEQKSAQDAAGLISATLTSAPGAQAIPRAALEALRRFLAIVEELVDTCGQQQSQIGDLQTSQAKVIQVGQMLQEQLQEEIAGLQSELQQAYAAGGK